MRIIDIEALKNCPTSRFLRKETVAKLFPDKLPKRMNFLFRHNVPLEVDDKIGKVLLDTFSDHLHLEGKAVKTKVKKDKVFEATDLNDGEIDGLEALNYKELKELACKTYDIPFKRLFCTRPAVIVLIRHKKKTGIILSKEELKDRVEGQG